MFPDYDFKWLHNKAVTRAFPSNRHDTCIDSLLLNIRLSYRWFPEINEALVMFLNYWFYSLSPSTPMILFLGKKKRHNWNIFRFLYSAVTQGFGAHYVNNTDENEYERSLMILAPALKQLSKNTKIIWVAQNPIIETYGNTLAAMARKTSQRKLDHFNRIARNVLK
jgi:hypothetical protein